MSNNNDNNNNNSNNDIRKYMIPGWTNNDNNNNNNNNNNRTTTTTTTSTSTSASASTSNTTTPPKDDKPSFLRKAGSTSSNAVTAAGKGNQLYHGKRSSSFPTLPTPPPTKKPPVSKGLPKNFSAFDNINNNNNKFNTQRNNINNNNNSINKNMANTQNKNAARQPINRNNNNNSNNNNNKIPINNDSMFDLSKLGVHQYSSNYVESKVIHKIDKEIVYNEIRELDIKLKQLVKEREEHEEFLFKNNEREINSTNKDMDKDTLNSLIALITFKKKKVSELKNEEKTISTQIFNKKETLRIEREKRIEEQRRKSDGSNSLSSSGSGESTLGELPLPSLFDKAFGFSTTESERDRLIRTGKITPLSDMAAKTNKKTILLDTIVDVNDLQQGDESSGGINPGGSKVVMKPTANKKTNRFDQPKKKKALTPSEKKKQQKMKKYSVPRDPPKKLQEFYDDFKDLDTNGNGSNDDDDEEEEEKDNEEEEEGIKDYYENKEKKQLGSDIEIDDNESPKQRKHTTTTTTTTSKPPPKPMLKLKPKPKPKSKSIQSDYEMSLSISLSGRIRTPMNRLPTATIQQDDGEDEEEGEDEEDIDVEEDEEEAVEEEDDMYTDDEMKEDEIEPVYVSNKNKKKAAVEKKRKRKQNEDDDFDGDEEEEEEEEEEEFEPLQLNIHKERWTDDGNEKVYQKRLLEWKKKKIRDRIKKMNQQKRLQVLENYTNSLINDETEENEEETNPKQYNQMEDEYLDNDKIDKELVLNNGSGGINNQETIDQVISEEIVDEEEEIGDDYQIDENFKIPFEIYKNLFEYQVTGVRWLYELHSQETGGIVGDEMGLGKTIQIVSFLASLHYSRRLGGPALIVAPATLLSNWVKEFHKWWPPFRIGLFHSSGNDGTGDKEAIVRKIASQGHILLTTFDSIRIHQDILLKYHWEYVILDEGHKIRNPDAEITLSCKQFQTPHRVILSGSPIQNKLTELWSLFDFVFPGRLGTLPIFKSQFSLPISVGGFANATPIQVQTAYKCAVALRDLISPYMLRRVKSDVLKSLPSKNEQVLMCPLSQFQETMYLEYLDSNDIKSVLDGKRNALYGIDILKKICNHPDILHMDVNDEDRPKDYGNPDRSAKLKVVETILPLWFKQGDKVLLFCQTRQMLNIVEDFIQSSTSFQYLRMDGTTSIKQRQGLVEQFNMDPNLFLFLLTTKVGGLGLNLTGANRVILFDPDWNPSTDMQARERVYRIGQKKSVTIYRLITLGTIEEKIYHRQIYKQFLTNKILKDPRQKRFFKSKHFKDLFTYTKNKKGSETGDIFSASNSEILPEHLSKKKQKPQSAIGSGVGIGNSKSVSLVPSIPKVRKEDGENDKQSSDDNDDIVGSKRGGRKRLKNNNNVEVNKDSADDDSYILKCLFDNQGLKSALKHDTIMNQSGPEHALLVSEAENIASKAVSILKKSREQISKSYQTPTWTGKFGSSGAPSIISPTINNNNNNTTTTTTTTTTTSGGGRFGNKSKLPTLLTPTQQINNITANSENTLINSPPVVSNNNNNNNSRFSSSKLLSTLNSEEEANATALFGGLNPSEIIEKIFNFIMEKGGSVTTQAIINNFSLTISEEQAPLFKVLLRSVSEFSKVSKRWVVKSEFLLS